MIKSLTDYKFLDCIHNDGIISLHYAQSRLNDTPLLVKLPVNESDRQVAALSFLKNEYAVCLNNCKDVVLPSVRYVGLNNSCLVEYQHRDVVPLALCPEFRDRSLPVFLNTALSLVKLLLRLHEAGIVHRNCSPYTFLKSNGSGVHYLTGFYIASTPDAVFNDETMPLFYPPNCRYIAPEQTGNIDRPTDERTDLYVLGIIFYEMISGEPPFTDADISSLIYSHVARDPIPLYLKNEDVPRPLSDIIGKLLEKNPADRYQSASGLLSDLEECRSYIDQKKPITCFYPGSRDRITRLLPIKKLYGRDNALKEINDAFIRANSCRASAVFISGPAGVGKTSLIDSFLRSIDRTGVLFAQGKCEATSTTVPYHALNNAMVDLIRSIISAGNETIARWKDILLEAIGYNREIIAEFIPQIQMIIGPCRQRKLHADAVAGTQFKNVLIRFLRSFIQKDSTLVVFIDDLQWADSALSTILIPAFFEAVDRRLLLIGAGRSGLDENNQLIKEIVGKGASVKYIRLNTLSFEDTKLMIADALGAADEDIRELQTIVFEKTGGNPLFLKEFLEMLISRRLLVHSTLNNAPAFSSPKGMAWRWQKDKILQLECSENVVDIILEKTALLAPSSRSLLNTASCMGMQFNGGLLCSIVETEPSEAEKALTEALDIGILQYAPSIDCRNTSRELRFSHDRIREAFYERIDPVERTKIHLKIGRALLRLIRNGSIECSVFDIVKHFNPFNESISEQTERNELVRLNQEAANRSRNANACEIAQEYLQAAIAFLPADSWKTDQNMRFELELSLAECHYMLCRMDESLRRLSILAQHAVDQRQLAAIDLVRMLIFYHRKEPDLAIKVGFERLKAMGMNLPQRPSILYILLNIVRTAVSIRGILRCGRNDPASNQPVSESTLYSFRILSRIWLYAFTFRNQRLVAAVVTHLILSTRVYGQFGAASVAVCFWGILIGKLTGNPLRGLRYGTLALSIAQRFDDLFSRGITYFLYGSFFAHLEGHLDSSLALLKEGQHFSYEAGDIISSSNSTEGYVLIYAISGKNLCDVGRCAVESVRFLELIGITAEGTAIIRFIQSWAEKMEKNLGIDATFIARTRKEIPLVRGIYLLLSMFTSIVAGDYKTSLLFARELKGSPLLDPTSYFYYLFTFLYALGLSYSVGETPSGRSNRLLRKELSILKKGARLSPVNMRHLFLLISAEDHRLNKRRWEALQCYRQAIEAARQHNFIHHAAIAAERAASFMKPYDIEESRTFLRTALSLYNEWGSQAKIALLKREAPDVAFNPLNRLSLSGSVTEIDFQALLKSFETITNELNINRLLEKLIRIIIEHAGAQRGVLLLEEKGALFARVEGMLKLSDIDNASVIESSSVNIPSEQFPVPPSIISYVQRSGEAIRLENAASRDRFVYDPYIKKRNTRSVLCVPLVNKERVRGIVYLENNMLEAAFPPSRLLLIRILCGQAIISIENALFHDMEINHLQSRVNPHFLFNALSSIAEICHSDPDATEDAVIKLSSLYRYVLKAETQLVSLEEELEIVNKYLSIEKLRFGNRLSYNLRITGDPSLVKMPCMLIQPLVENSIKHGLTPRPSGGTINITVTVAGGRCDVTVEDDGVGPNKSAHGTGYGLESIRKRLELQYHDDAVFEINDVAGFRVRISIPYAPE